CSYYGRTIQSQLNKTLKFDADSFTIQQVAKIYGVSTPVLPRRCGTVFRESHGRRASWQTYLLAAESACTRRCSLTGGTSMSEQGKLATLVQQLKHGEVDRRGFMKAA